MTTGEVAGLVARVEASGADSEVVAVEVFPEVAAFPEGEGQVVDGESSSDAVT